MPDVPLAAMIEHMFLSHQGMVGFGFGVGGGRGWLSNCVRSQATGACATTGWRSGGGVGGNKRSLDRVVVHGRLSSSALPSVAQGAGACATTDGGFQAWRRWWGGVGYRPLADRRARKHPRYDRGGGPEWSLWGNDRSLHSGPDDGCARSRRARGLGRGGRFLPGLVDRCWR
jgi:hypothetical protein